MSEKYLHVWIAIRKNIPDTSVAGATVLFSLTNGVISGDLKFCTSFSSSASILLQRKEENLHYDDQQTDG